MAIIRNSIPPRSSRGLTRTAPDTEHQGISGDKWETDALVPSIRARKDIVLGTWNVRTLRADGQLEILEHELERYQWEIIGLAEMRWKGFGETSTDNGHRLFYSGRQDRHQDGVGFLVHKNIVNSIIECKPVSSRHIAIRLKATPFNLTIIQVYAPTTEASDETIEDFYSQLDDMIRETPKKDILIILGDWNAKIGTDAYENWSLTMGPYCNDRTNDRGLRLLEFAGENNLVVANTLGPHKPSRRWTWHSPCGQYHNQIDYILVQKRFRSGININRTRSFPGADIGSDHELVMMTFRTRLSKINKPKPTRLKFNLEKLKDPQVMEQFQAVIGGKFAPLLALDTENDLDATIDQMNSAIIDTANDLLGKYHQPKKPWITAEVLQLCDTRRQLKNAKRSPEGANKYREINRKVKAELRKAKEHWIHQQCEDIERNLRNNNTKKAYQVIKELTSANQRKRVIAIQSKDGTRLTEEQQVLERWTEYCSELYNHQLQVNPAVLTLNHEPPNEDFQPILRDEVEKAVQTLKKGKAAGVDNIPGELIQAGGDPIIDIYTKICNTILQTGIWPTIWTKSLVITIPKKGNLELCDNFRTISLISHPSKVMLNIILNRLKPIAEQIIAEEQAGFRPGRSTTEQIFNLRIINEKYNQHQQDLHQVFIDFRKAFDRVWQAALWTTMKKFNIDNNLIQAIQNLYNRAKSAVLYNNNIGEWFATKVGVRQGCLLSPTLFNLFLEMIMNVALEDHEGSVSIAGQTITNLRFADDIVGLAGTAEELTDLTNRINTAAETYGMEINAQKTKIMSNNPQALTNNISVAGTSLEVVENFKYLGSVISEEGSKPELLARIGQTTAALAKLNHLWRNRAISLRSKIQLMRSLVTSIFIYACETWTLTAELQRRISALEMRCYIRMLGITYRDRITNAEVTNRITHAIGQHDNLLTIIRKRKLTWYGHVTRATGLTKAVLQGTVRGGRRRGGQKKRWENNIQDWTGLRFAESQRLAQNRELWRNVVASSSSTPLRLQ